MPKTSTALAVLAEQAKSLGDHKSRHHAIVTALNEYVRRRKQKEIIKLFGTIEFDPAYDYKRARKSKRG